MPKPRSKATPSEPDKSPNAASQEAIIAALQAQNAELKSQLQACQNQLRHLENKKPFLFDSNPQPMWFFDPTTLAFLDVNDAAIAHYGYSRDEFLAMTVADIRPAEDVPALRSLIPLVSNAETLWSYSGEWRHRRQDGSLIDVEISAHRGNWQNKTAIFVIAKDISDRKRAEATLKQQIASTQTLNRVIRRIRNSLDLDTIFATTMSEVAHLLQVEQVGILKYWPERKSWAMVTEYQLTPTISSRAEFEAPDQDNPIADQLKRGETVRVDDAATLDDSFNRQTAEQYPGAWLIVPLQVDAAIWGALSVRYGHPHFWQDSEVELAEAIADQLAIAIQQANLFRQVQSELAHRQRVETELRQLNQALEQQVQERTAQLQQQLAEIEAIYQSAPIGLNFLDTDLRFIRINQRLAEMNGLPVEAHIGRTVREVLPDLADAADQLLRPILQTGEPLLNVEIQGETPAQPGVQRVWLESFLPLKNGDQVIGISTVCEEITHRKQAEAELHRAHQQLEERATQLESINQSLQNVMEELEISQEELQQQNEELIEAHQSIDEQRERYQDLFNFAPDGYIVTNAMGLIREVNQAAFSLLFSNHFDPIGIPFNLYVSEEDQRTLRNQLYEASHSRPTSHIHEFELTLMPRKGHPFPAAIAITAIRGSQGHLTGFRWLIRDVSDRKRTEITLQQQAKQEQTLRRITQEIRQSLDLTTVLETATAEVNQTLQTDRVAIYRFHEDWSGSFIAESVGQGWVPLVGSQARKVWEDTHLQETQGGRYRNHETFAVSDIYTAGHMPCHIQLLEQFQARAYAIAPILVGNSLWGLLGIYQNRGPRDWQTWEVELLKQIADQLAIAIQQSQLYKQVQTELQERQRAEEKLRRSLQEKEVLLKEIHHRVKNNMQLVSSMLRLQTDNISDPVTLELFNESQQRVKTMALIHEHLYRLHDLAHINFASYIQDLARDVLLSYKKSIASVKLTLDIESIDLDLDTAIPCGLIVNELMSNALKYAFPNEGDRAHASTDSNHEIKIQFKRDEPTGYVLTVQDNGIGISTTVNPETTNTLGLQLVYGLTHQLRGQLELARDRGSTFTIRFGHA